MRLVQVYARLLVMAVSSSRPPSSPYAVFRATDLSWCSVPSPSRAFSGPPPAPRRSRSSGRRGSVSLQGELFAFLPAGHQPQQPADCTNPDPSRVVDS